MPQKNLNTKDSEDNDFNDQMGDDTDQDQDNERYSNNVSGDEQNDDNDYDDGNSEYTNDGNDNDSDNYQQQTTTTRPRESPNKHSSQKNPNTSDISSSSSSNVTNTLANSNSNPKNDMLSLDKNLSTSNLRVEKQQVTTTTLQSTTTPTSTTVTTTTSTPTPAPPTTSGRGGRGGGRGGGRAGYKKKSDKKIITTYDFSKLDEPIPENYSVLCFVNGAFLQAQIVEFRFKKDVILEGDYAESVIPKPYPRETLPYDYETHPYTYYIHYVRWDRRMDEWVDRSRLRFAQELVMYTKDTTTSTGRKGLNALSYLEGLPLDGASSKQKDLITEQVHRNDENRIDIVADSTKPASLDVTISDSTGDQNKIGDKSTTDIRISDSKMSDIEISDSKSTDTTDVQEPTPWILVESKEDALSANQDSNHGHFSEDDLHDHNSVTKVKNINEIVLGRYIMPTWYHSPFPDEYRRARRLHFCEYCLSFFVHEVELLRHVRKCCLRHPPGYEIYRSEENNVTISMYEVDGLRERVYCENLCYISKLFLDHKTLHEDCSIFLFYILCEVSPRGCTPVGYFSKEKLWTQNNLACILTLPCHQRKGYGKFLISMSYELSKFEGRIGGPERPLSDLGRVSYINYWFEKVAYVLQRMLMLQNETISKGGYSNNEPEVSLEELAILAHICIVDVQDALKEYNLLVWDRGRWTLSKTRLLQYFQQKEEKKQKLKEIEIEKKKKGIPIPKRISVRPAISEKINWTAFMPAANKKRRADEDSGIATESSGGAYRKSTRGAWREE